MKMNELLYIFFFLPVYTFVLCVAIAVAQSLSNLVSLVTDNQKHYGTFTNDEAKRS